jgi:hypothetical protein
MPSRPDQRQGRSPVGPGPLLVERPAIETQGASMALTVVRQFTLGLGRRAPLAGHDTGRSLRDHGPA